MPSSSCHFAFLNMTRRETSLLIVLFRVFLTRRGGISLLVVLFRVFHTARTNARSSRVTSHFKTRRGGISLLVVWFRLFGHGEERCPSSSYYFAFLNTARRIPLLVVLFNRLFDVGEEGDSPHVVSHFWRGTFKGAPGTEFLTVCRFRGWIGVGNRYLKVRRSGNKNWVRYWLNNIPWEQFFSFFVFGLLGQCASFRNFFWKTFGLTITCSCLM